MWLTDADDQTADVNVRYGATCSGCSIAAFSLKQVFQRQKAFSQHSLHQDRLPSAKNQPLDSSARKLLILKGSVCGLCGLPDLWPGRAGETNGQEKAKCGHVGPGRLSGEVRKNPRQSAQACGSAKKRPTGEPVGLGYWWSNTDPGSNSLPQQVGTVSGVCPRIAEIVNFICGSHPSNSVGRGQSCCQIVRYALRPRYRAVEHGRQARAKGEFVLRKISFSAIGPMIMRGITRRRGTPRRGA